jgi:hypothetical protein
MDRIEGKAERRIILKRCMVQYILGSIFRASFKFCMGDKLREKMEWGKGMKRFSVHFNVHTPIQTVFLNNFEKCKSPFKNETIHQESSQDRYKKH